MAAPLKTNGLSELRSLRQRCRRQRSMGRIGKSDFEFIDSHLDEIEARIVHMSERDDRGMEIS